MTKTLLLAALGSTLALGFAAAPASAHKRNHHTKHHAMAPMAGMKLMGSLTGAAEIPAADPDGTGMFMASINPGHNKLCYTLTSTMIAAPTAAHIHAGEAGTNGPPVVMLMTTPGEHCVAIAPALAMKIMKEPDDYYVNVHTAVYPDGAIRSQLSK